MDTIFYFSSFYFLTFKRYMRDRLLLRQRQRLRDEEANIINDTESWVMDMSISNEDLSSGSNYHHDPMSCREDEEERAVFIDAVAAFANFAVSARTEFTTVYRNMLYSLPSEQVKLLRNSIGIFQTLDQVDCAIERNGILAEAIALNALDSFGSFDTLMDRDGRPVKLKGNESKAGTRKLTLLEQLKSYPPPSAAATQRVRSLMHQFYREWSTEAETERKACYRPVVEALNSHFQGRNRRNIQVLIPGAGLGRLVYDFARQGYSSVGNEISYEALLASSFILNTPNGVGKFEIYPFALQFKNVVSRQSQFLKVNIPDVDPTSPEQYSQESTEDIFTTPPSGAIPTRPSQSVGNMEYQPMQMEAGDFIEIYSSPESKNRFDALTSVFFIDTCPNPLLYFAAAANCVKPGGLWVNLGPLLWHTNYSPGDSTTTTTASTAESSKFSISNATTSRSSRSTTPSMGGQLSPNEIKRQETGQQISVPLADEEIVKLLPAYGFRLLEHRASMPQTGYGSHPESMLAYNYRPSFWVAIKEEGSIIG